VSTAAIDSRRPHTVTFDCWATLLHESDAKKAPGARARMVASATDVSVDEAESALRIAWARHQSLWHRCVAFTGVDMTHLTLQTLGVELAPPALHQLITALEEEILDHDVRALEGAREALATLAGAGVRRALICDTGFTPGRVVRRLLERVGLLELLEVQVFSNEIGVPKPHPKAFQTALRGLGTSPAGAVHVGDLRRSDIAGARAAAMGTVRIRALNDDGDAGAGPNAGVIDCRTAACDPLCARPEADHVADSHQHLLEILGFG